MSSHISLLASDSKHFVRGGMVRKYKGCLGVCLAFTHPEDFKTNYDTTIDQILNSVGISRTKHVYKSYDFGRVFGDKRAEYLDALASFVKMLSTNGININVVYTTFNLGLLPQGIKKYGIGRYPAENKDPLAFLDDLIEYYPYIAAWKVSKIATLRNANVLLDNFGGEVTNAWGELCAHHSVQVVLKGCSCNPYISAADLVTKYIDEYLSQKHLNLNEDPIRLGFEACGVTDVHIFYVGHPDLDNITPIKKEKIDLSGYYKRPMIFILKEEILESEIRYIENSPMWDKILNFAFIKDAGIKYMNYEQDYHYLRSGDYLIYLGEKGKGRADYLQKLGYGIVPIASSEVSEQDDFSD